MIETPLLTNKDFARCAVLPTPKTTLRYPKFFRRQTAHHAACRVERTRYCSSSSHRRYYKVGRVGCRKLLYMQKRNVGDTMQWLTIDESESIFILRENAKSTTIKRRCFTMMKKKGEQI